MPVANEAQHTWARKNYRTQKLTNNQNRNSWITRCAGGHHNTLPALQVDLWPFDLESGVRVTCNVSYLCANFSLPGPLCSRLRPDVRGRLQTNVRRASSLNASALWGRGITTKTYNKDSKSLPPCTEWLHHSIIDTVVCVRPEYKKGSRLCVTTVARARLRWPHTLPVLHSSSVVRCRLVWRHADSVCMCLLLSKYTCRHRRVLGDGNELCSSSTL